MGGINWRKAAVIAAVATFIWLARDVITYVLGILAGASLIAALISPLQKRLESRLPRTASIVAAWLLLFAIGIIGVVMLAPVIVRQAVSLCEAWPRFCEYVGQYLTLSEPVRWSASEVTGMIGKLMGVFAQVGDGLGMVMGTFSRFGMMWIASIFLLMEKEKYLLMAELLIPYRNRKQALRLGQRMLRELKLFIGGQATVGLCVGALTAIGLMLIGLRSGLLLGVITGLFNLIPYFGPVLAAVPVLLLAWMDGWTRAALAGLVLIVVQQIDGFFISPKIMSSATGLSPLVVLIALSAGGFAFGVPGMVLAIPGAIVCRILFTELVQNRVKYYK